MRRALARALRSAASLLDGVETIPARWHRGNVASMNRYVGRTERYVIALEELVPEQELERLRREHGRFDTRPLAEAGAWEEGRA